MDGGRPQFANGCKAGPWAGLLAGLLACAGCQTLAPATSSPQANSGRLADLAQEQGPVSTPAGNVRQTAGTTAANLSEEKHTQDLPNAAKASDLGGGPAGRFHGRSVQFNSPADKVTKDNTPIPANLSGPENVGLYPHRYPPMKSPGELRKISLPTYVIQPPDVLLIDAVKLVPKSPYRIEALDQLDVKVAGTLPDQPISANYAVEPSGGINLGPTYGRVMIQGLTLEEATHAVDQHLRRMLKEPEVSITLVASAGQQQIAGEHLVGPDGTVNLGTYGSVYLTGLTVDQARAVLEKHLSKYLESPRVSIDVYAYNSLVYYVISDGAGNGDSVTRFPITGNETVLDALSQVNGLTRANSKKIWIARPAPAGMNCDQILVVNYYDIVRGGSTDTNYQLLPGDRLYLEGDHFIEADSMLAKIIAPFERVFGFTLLGSSVIQNIHNFPGGPNGRG